MYPLSEALGTLKQDEDSIIHRMLKQKQASFDRVNQHRPEEGWGVGSREAATEQRMLGGLDDFHRKYWKTVGPRGQMTPQEVADKNWWGTRSNFATKSYNKVNDEYNRFMEKPTVKSTRLQLKISTDMRKRREDLGAWYDAIADKEHESGREKLIGTYDKGLPTIPDTGRDAYLKDHQRQLKQLDLDYSMRKSALRRGELGRDTEKKKIKESVMSKPRLIVQLAEKKQDSVAKGSTYMIDPKTGGEAKMPKPKKAPTVALAAHRYDKTFGTDSKVKPFKIDPNWKPQPRQASVGPAPKGYKSPPQDPWNPLTGKFLPKKQGIQGPGGWINTAAPALSSKPGRVGLAKSIVAPIDAVATVTGVGALGRGALKLGQQAIKPGNIKKIADLGKQGLTGVKNIVGTGTKVASTGTKVASIGARTVNPSTAGRALNPITAVTSAAMKYGPKIAAGAKSKWTKAGEAIKKFKTTRATKAAQKTANKEAKAAARATAQGEVDAAQELLDTARKDPNLPKMTWKGSVPRGIVRGSKYFIPPIPIPGLGGKVANLALKSLGTPAADLAAPARSAGGLWKSYRNAQIAGWGTAGAGAVTKAGGEIYGSDALKKTGQTLTGAGDAITGPTRTIAKAVTGDPKGAAKSVVDTVKGIPDLAKTAYTAGKAMIKGAAGAGEFAIDPAAAIKQRKTDAAKNVLDAQPKPKPNGLTPDQKKNIKDAWEKKQKAKGAK